MSEGGQIRTAVAGCAILLLASFVMISQQQQQQQQQSSPRLGFAVQNPRIRAGRTHVILSSIRTPAGRFLQRGIARPVPARCAGTASPGMATTADSGTPQTKTLTQEARVKLATLGFYDEEEIQTAFVSADGDLDVVIRILTSEAADEWNSERRDIDELMEKGG